MSWFLVMDGQIGVVSGGGWGSCYDVVSFKVVCELRVTVEVWVCLEEFVCGRECGVVHKLVT